MGVFLSLFSVFIFFVPENFYHYPVYFFTFVLDVFYGLPLDRGIYLQLKNYFTDKIVFLSLQLL